MPKSSPFSVAVEPVCGYLGGKRNLARRLIERIAAHPHDIYAEPFVGMGGVFLRRPSRAKVEVINDASREVVTLFRILQRHYPQFLETLKFQITSRAEFERLVATRPDTLTDLERAARFLYLQRTAFGAKVTGQSYGVSYTGSTRFDLTKLGPMMEAVHERLAGVSIECLDWAAFIDRYDRPKTLFYLDPPYWGSEGDYGQHLFDRSQFTDLAKRLRSIKGRFILSINDVPEIRAIFKGFKITAVDVSYSVARVARPKVRELIIEEPVRGIGGQGHRTPAKGLTVGGRRT